MQDNKFNIMLDSAWGSSAKASASTRLADVFGITHLSTCNSTNSGHTTLLGDDKFVFKVLPSGSVLRRWIGRDMQLYVGPTAGYEIHQLEKELEYTRSTFDNVFIHERVAIITDEHKALEAGGSMSTKHLASTMSGAGAAAMQKMMRLPGVTLHRNTNFKSTNNWDFYEKFKTALASNTFLHEVAQGYALSLNAGTHFPSCTSRDCTPQQACADFGVHPKEVGDVYLNIRSFPIRVGHVFNDDGTINGNSGDFMSDQIETSWEEIGKNAEMPLEEIAMLAEREKTTITKRVRRCFKQSNVLLERSAKFCGATKAIYNFPQYDHWSAYKVRGGTAEFKQMHSKVRAAVENIENVTGIPVVMIGTGPEHNDYVVL